MWEEFLEILKYTIPAIIVLLANYAIVRNFLLAESRKLELQLRKEYVKDTLLLRLQAYERLMIFLERISPPNLLVRVDKDGLTLREFQKELVATIRVEYEHNLSQQIYVSADTWRAICIAKDETIKVINLISVSIDQNATPMDMARDILKFYMDTEQPLPGDTPMELIKADVKKLL